MSTPFADISKRFRIVLDQLFPTASLHARAIELGIHVNSLGKYLRGERLPSVDSLHALVRWGVDVTWILSGEGTPFTDANQQRKVRLHDALAQVTDRALANEWERRVQRCITEGLELLHELAEHDLEPLAQKLRTRLSNDARPLVDEIRLMLCARRANRCLDRVAWWLGDLDASMHDAYAELVRLHERVTVQPAFRTLIYEPAADPALRSFLADSDRSGQLTELVTGKNLGHGVFSRRDVESAEVSDVPAAARDDIAAALATDTMDTMLSAQGQGGRRARSETKSRRKSAATKTPKRKSKKR